jgi:hypothetical protein
MMDDVFDFFAPEATSARLFIFLDRSQQPTYGTVVLEYQGSGQGDYNDRYTCEMQD